MSNKSIDPRSRFSSMMRLLADWRKRIEYRVASIRSRIPDKSGAAHHYKGFSNDRNAKQNNGRSKSSSGSKSERCWIHNYTGDHPIWRCKIFQNKPVAERIELAKSNKACMSCLEVGHSMDECTRDFKCIVDGCGEKHNKWLHETEQVLGTSNHADDNDSTGNGSAILPLQEL